MVTAYFERKIKKQNQFIYLKKGRWIGVLFMLGLSILLAEARLHLYAFEIQKMFQNWNATLLISLPYFLAYVIMILYLVPYYFKRNKFKQFWIRISLSILIWTLMEFLILQYIAGRGWMPLYESAPLELFFKSFLNQMLNILGLTGILYIYEILEEVYLSKESLLNIQVWKESERQMIGTKTDFPYMLQSLRGINSKLKAEGRINETTHASESMLLFADILRYKLYGYDLVFVPVSEEIGVVSNLVRFYNSVLNTDIHSCDLEIVGQPGDWHIEKQLLINMVYPFLKNSEQPFFSNIVCFIEMEGGVLNLTLQADYTIAVEMEQILSIVTASVAKNTNITNFETQDDNNCLILNICLTLSKK